MTTTSGAPALRGRPRSASADAAILDAARDVLAEVGWVGLTVEGVAARAGVAKTTVYRRFASRTELAVEALATLIDEIRLDTAPEPGASPGELTRQAIHAVADVYRRPAARAAYLAVVAETWRDPELRAAVDSRVLRPARQIVVDRLAVAVQRGELTPEVARDQADLLFDVVAGTLMHRLLVREQDVDDAFVDSLSHAVVVGLGIEPPSHPAPSTGDAAV